MLLLSSVIVDTTILVKNLDTLHIFSVEYVVGRPRWQKVPLKRVDGNFMLEAGNRHFLIV